MVSSCVQIKSTRVRLDYTDKYFVWPECQNVCIRALLSTNNFTNDAYVQVCRGVEIYVQVLFVTVKETNYHGWQAHKTPNTHTHTYTHTYTIHTYIHTQAYTNAHTDTQTRTKTYTHLLINQAKSLSSREAACRDNGGNSHLLVQGPLGGFEVLRDLFRMSTAKHKHLRTCTCVHVSKIYGQHDRHVLKYGSSVW